MHEGGLVRDPKGTFSLGSHEILANICIECARALGKAANQRHTQQSHQTDVAQPFVESEAAAHEEAEEEKKSAITMLPRFLRCRDWGKVPAELPRLNTLERLVLQRVVVFHTTYQITAQGARALKGTTIAFPHDAFERLDVMLMSGRDLARFVNVVVVATPGVQGLVQRIARDPHLLLDIDRIRQWAAFLIKHHPSYKQFAHLPRDEFTDVMARKAADLRAKLLEDVAQLRIQ